MKCGLVLLCGGRSSRMGEPKALLDFFGRPWITEQLRRAALASLDKVTVVTGAHHDSIEKTIATLGLDVHPVFNEHWERGAFSSVQRGLQNVFSTLDACDVYVSPIDVPLGSPRLLSALAEARESAGALAALPRYGDKGGHPVLLSCEFARSLLTLEPTGLDARLDVQLRKVSQRLTYVLTDESCVIENLNDAARWETFLKDARNAR